MTDQEFICETSLAAGQRGLELDALCQLLTEVGYSDPLTAIDALIDSGQLIPNVITGRLVHERFASWGGCKNGTCRYDKN